MKFTFFLTFILIASLHSFGQNNPNLEVLIPSKIAAGKKYSVEVTINKADLKGFGQFQQKLPKGITAVEAQSSKGTFRFEKNTLSISWLVMPLSQDIYLMYDLIVDSNVDGSFPIVSEFSAMQNNQKFATKINSLIEVTSADKNLVGKSSTNFQAERQEVSVSDAESEIWVSLRLQKGNTTGKASLYELLPTGMAAFPGITNGSVFSVRNDSILFEWKQLPKEATFAVSYYLVPLNDIQLNKLSLSGFFSILIEKRSESIAISSSANASQLLKQNTVVRGKGISALSSEDQKFVSILDEAKNQKKPVENSKKTSANKEGVKKDLEKTKVNKTKNEKLEGEKDKKTVEKPKKDVKKKETEQKVVYKVQILSSTEKVNPEYFVKLDVTEAVTEEKVDGVFKYTVGAISNFTKAIEYSHKLAKNPKLKGPFVITYINGVRTKSEEKKE